MVDQTIELFAICKPVHRFPESKPYGTQWNFLLSRPCIGLQHKTPSKTGNRIGLDFVPYVFVCEQAPTLCLKGVEPRHRFISSVEIRPELKHTLLMDLFYFDNSLHQFSVLICFLLSNKHPSSDNASYLFFQLLLKYIYHSKCH